MLFILKGAVCSATGDPHYTTFDGRRYKYMGNCEYVLAKDSNETFTILQENEPCGRGAATCTNAITVKLPEIIIHLSRGESVVINGANVKLPYENKGMEKLLTKITVFID